MKKYTLISLLMALLLCATVVLSACTGMEPQPVDPSQPGSSEGEQPGVTPEETPEATEVQRKDAVLAFMSGVNSGIGDIGGTAIPEVPTMDTFAAGLYETLQGLSFSGTAQGDVPAMGMKGMDYVLTMTDGKIFLTDPEGINKACFYADERMNLIMISETEAGVAGNTLPVTALIPDIFAMAGGMIPEDYVLPELPPLTAEDLVVSGDRVIIAKAYIRTMAETFMQAYADMMEIEDADLASALEDVNDALDCITLDIYFTVDKSAKLTGYGIEFDTETITELYETLPAAKLSAALTLAPENGMPVSCSMVYEDAEETITLNSKVIYLQTTVISVDADVEIKNNDETVEMQVKFNYAGLLQNEANILTISATTKKNGTEDKYDVGTIVADKKGKAVELTIALHANPIEAPEDMLIDVVATLDLTTITAAPELSEAMQGIKELADLQISKLDQIIAIRDALCNVEGPTGFYAHYYYDAETMTQFFIHAEEDELTGGFAGWGVTFGFATAAAEDHEIDIVKNSDGTYSIIVSPEE